MSGYYNPYEEEPQVAAPAEEPAPPAKAPRKPRAAKSAAKPARDWTGWRMFGGVVLLLFAAYTLVATLSMLMHPGADQAAVQYNSVGQIVSTGTDVENVAGPTGAVLSNFVLTSAFGLGSLVMVVWLGVSGLMLGGWIHRRFWPFTLKCLVLTITVSMLAGFLTLNAATPMRFGGNHGYYVNHWLVEYTSIIGALCVNIALLALVIIIFLTQITNAIEALKAKIKSKKESPSPSPSPSPLNALNALTPLTPSEPSEPEEPDTYEAPADITGPVEPEADPSDSFQITVNEIEEADEIVTDTYDPTAELSHYHFPPIDLLEERQGSKATVDTEEQEANKQRIIDALAQFKIQISSISATVGPTITLFEVVPAPGQRISSIKRLEEDIALALKAMSIRIIAPMPGKGTIGIEVPNADPQVVSMRSIIASKKFQESKAKLPMALGATISNEVFIADLAKMPHLLVAGATGQGKSVGLNAIITSLLYKKHPAELKFVLVDPKMVEFSLYKVLEKHYLAKLPDEDEAVITDCNKVVATLNSLCVEMDNRYELLSRANCRDISEYNPKFIAKQLIPDPMNPHRGHRFMPYIVLIIDEFADLIMQAGKEIEVPLCRIAQKARAVGIHAIIATQRPSTNVVTGLIKAQFPGRIAFRVAQMTDSKTILDRSGAHQLIGKGDMFFSTNGNIERVQCAFVDTPEVQAICECISEQQSFGAAYELPEYVPDPAADGGGAALGGQPGSPFDRDPLFEEAARFLVTTGSTASTSSLQRRYNIGYNRAGRLMDQLEAAGIVGPAYGSKPRQVLVDPMTLDSMLL